MNSLTEQVLEFARSWGVALVGVATRETLAGGPPSVDLEYILPGARSAVSIAVPLNTDHSRAYLAKKDRRSHEQDNFRVNMEATGVAAYLARYLEQKGHPSQGVTSNDAYREEVPGGRQSMLPDLSHRYLAVRSGVGWFGFSGGGWNFPMPSEETTCAANWSAAGPPGYPRPAAGPPGRRDDS